MNKKPNVIIITTDDQGYGDLSCMGNTDFVTPNFDTLAEMGTRFACMYSGSPVCSPSRACLLTGLYPKNTGVTRIISAERTSRGLTEATPTIATALKKNGYNTAAIGKWHLGVREECRPGPNGFDYFYGFTAGCIDYYSHIFYWGDGVANPLHDLWENEKEIYNNGKYFTELITEKTVDYIQNAPKDKPFFTYVAYNAPHYPMHAPAKYVDRFKGLPSDRRIMAAMLSAVDDGIGEIINALKRRGELEDTIIYFQSDNGPSRESRNWLDGNPDFYYGGTTGGLKGHKFSLFEGGIRIPAIISYPRALPSHNVSEEPYHAIDVFKTILDLAGIDDSEYVNDGSSIVSSLQNGTPSPNKTLYWEMEDQLAIRENGYKLVINGREVEHEEPVAKYYLTKITDDFSERNNLADEMPELVKELEKKVTDWYNA